MGSSPPDNSKKGATKSPVQPNAEPPKDSSGIDLKQEVPVKNETANADPLGPPPRPAAAPSQTPDYFSVNHSSLETNPFEASFAFGNSAGSAANGGELRTPGGTKLPSVAALTSPAGILGGTGSTPSFWGGLRSGPLSPAMLSGPTKEDYFTDSHHLRGGFPTPNESGLRSGLTPGGGGTMFPEPSPNTAAMFNSIGGGATPGTMEFHRTAMNAAKASQSQQNITSQPQASSMTNGVDIKPVGGQFDQHDANDAANGLYLLAQSNNRNGAPPPQTNHYTMAPQMPVHAQQQQNLQMGGQSSETSPTTMQMRGSMSTTDGRGGSEFSDDNDTKGPSTRGKISKKPSTTAAQTNGRRKADETPSKAPASKKSKGSNGQAIHSEPQSEEEPDMSKEEYHANGKKMTDEEKRKNFLERNRVAALKCRQRKKQWLANLQQKVEVFSSENEALSQQISSLREEVVNLKTILMAHKDCPVSQQQGLSGMGMQNLIEGYAGAHQINPYGMAGQMGAPQVMGPGQPMQQNDRRYS